MSRVAARRASWGRVAALAPLLLTLLVFFIAPLLLTVKNSLIGVSGTASDFTLGRYADILTDPYYLGILWRTVLIGLATTVVSLLLGYPAALVLFFSPAHRARLFLLVIVSPLFVSVIVRTYGWLVLLSPDGPILSLLPAGHRVPILRTPAAIVIGLVHIFVPYMVLSINAALGRIDRRILRAAATLGVPNWRIFTGILLPLSAPGAISGCAIVFSLSVTAFSTPALLGGAANKTMAFMIYQQTLNVGDWESGDSLAMVLLAVTLLVLVLFSLAGRATDREAG